jgi:hypothetical protein
MIAACLTGLLLGMVTERRDSEYLVANFRARSIPRSGYLVASKGA